MKQLSNADGQLIHVETADAPEHIATLTIYDQGTAGNGLVRFKDILRTFETRLHRSPVFTNKIARVPFNLDQPFWVPDPRFELEYHLRHIALPQPGDWRQLCIQVSRLHAQPLDLSRPLWQAYVIEGLNNVEGVPENSFAVYIKIHHAAVDGMAFADFYSSLHDFKPILPKGEYGSIISQWDIPEEPGSLKLLGEASKHMARMPLEMAQTVADLVPEMIKSRRYKEEYDYEAAHAKPQTRFDTPVSRNRVFNGSQFPMTDIKAIRAAVPGATVNDVAVAIVSLALRHYLSSKRALPEKSLVGWIPVNVRPKGQAQKSGNEFALLAMTAHTDIADPKQLLTQIHKTTSAAKAYRENVGDDLFTRLTQFIPAPFQRYLGSITSLSANIGSSALPANFTISNVPNSPKPLYLAGAKAVRFQALGLLQHGLGLFHIISSYCDDFILSFLSCRDQMPDPQFYMECIEDAFQKLKGIVPDDRSVTRAKGRSTTKPKTRPKSDRAEGVSANA